MVRSSDVSEERVRLLPSPQLGGHHPPGPPDHQPPRDLGRQSDPRCGQAPRNQQENPQQYSRKKIHKNYSPDLQQTTFHFVGEQFCPIQEDIENTGGEEKVDCECPEDKENTFNFIPQVVKQLGWRLYSGPQSQSKLVSVSQSQSKLISAPQSQSKLTQNQSKLTCVAQNQPKLTCVVAQNQLVMSDTEDLPSPNPATLQALRDIVEDMEQMVKEAGETGEDESEVVNNLENNTINKVDCKQENNEGQKNCDETDGCGESEFGGCTSPLGANSSRSGPLTASSPGGPVPAPAPSLLSSGGRLQQYPGNNKLLTSLGGAKVDPLGADDLVDVGGSGQLGPGKLGVTAGTAAVTATTGAVTANTGSDNCSTCRLPGSTDLIVDVHLESSEDLPRPPCVKHSFDRFPRCYSESRGNMSREEFRNLDRIETIGEERLRHMSEGAGRLRTRWRDSRGIFGSEKGILHPSSSKSERKYEISEYDISVSSSNLGSIDDLESVASSSCSRLNLRMGRAAASRMEARPLSAKLDAGSSSSRNFSNKAAKQLDNGLPEVKFEIYNEGNAGFELEENLYDGDRGMYPSHHTSLDYTPRFKEDDNCGDMGASFKTTMSSSSSTTSMPICRICQLPSIEPSNHLISPCRCLGSIRYVHNPCLLKWLEVCSRKNSDAPCCELCQFQYIRKKRFVMSQCMLPSCSTRDRVLHSIFLLCVALMVTCAGVTILCFKQDRDSKPKTVGPNTELSPSELMTLCCGVLFFLAFFVAMYVEVKAKNTVYQLICKFLYMNYDWTIQEYDRKKDPAKQIEDS